jgi:outer membrane protein insertion porin family
MVFMRRILLCLLLLGGLLAAQQPVPQAAREFPIDSITIEGNRILSSAAIVAVSGLKTGQTGSGPIFDGARDRLLATGYFDTIAYRYKPAEKGGYNVTFEVQEIPTMFPVRIEGLPVTASEIEADLKARDPLFIGKMPGTQPAIRRTTAEIEQYLESKGHKDKVLGKMVATEPEKFEVQFLPARGLAVVSDVAFEGSKAILAADLHKAISEVAFGQPYSENGFRIFLQNQIVPLYEAKGYMKVTFPSVTTAPSTEVQGVDVKVTVDEGVEYKLTRVAVAGRSQSESAKILKQAKIPQMTVANFEQVREAAKRVQETMRHQGYLEARVTSEKKVDDAAKTVEFFLVVDTGPEYTFGKLTVSGLGLDGEDAIRKMWSVKPGDSFPDGYADYFLGRVKEEGLFDNLGATTAEKKVNAETHVVDVTLDFKGAPQKPKKPKTDGGIGFPPI